MEDDFVIFPNNWNLSNITIDVRHPGSQDPGCRGESGRQHRPTGPNTALRYSGEKDNGDTSGSIREAPLGTVSGVFGRKWPTWEYWWQAGQCSHSVSLVRLRAGYPADRHAEICDADRLDRDSQSTSSQSPDPLCYIVKVTGQGQTS